MGDYDINYDGVSLKAKVVDNNEMVDELIPTYFGSEDIIGLNFKSFTRSSVDRSLGNISSIPDILVLCGSSRCLIIYPCCYIRNESSLQKFLYNPNICFVRPSTLDHSVRGVTACVLAARVLKKPDLMQERSLEVVATQVGVPYQDVYGSSCRKGSIIVTSGYERILTEEEVKMVAYDAFKCHKIGLKLLSSSK